MIHQDKPVCWLNGAACHPTLPLLVTVGEDARCEVGQVALWDTARGALLHTWALENGAGWLGGCWGDRPRWAPHGVRLAVCSATNAITCMEDDRVVGSIIPDDTRDSPPPWCWVDDHIYTPAGEGALAAFVEGEELFDRDLRPMTAAAPGYHAVEWSAALGAVVGWSGDALIALDPRAERILYTQPLDDLIRGSSWPAFSPDLRWFGMIVRDQVILHDVSTGRVAARIPAPGARRLVWGPGGALAVLANRLPVACGELTHALIVRDGRVARELAFSRERGGGPDVAGSAQVAWSPDGARLALLHDRAIEVVEADSGRSRRLALSAPPAAPKMPDWMNPARQVTGLIWPDEDRFILVAPHYVGFYATDGHHVATHALPL